VFAAELAEGRREAVAVRGVDEVGDGEALDVVRE